MYEQREIYKHAPLALVAAEVKYPYAPRLRRDDCLDDIQIALEKILPIRQQEQRLTVQLTVGHTPAPAQKTVEVYRFLDRNRRNSAVISPEAFSVETTDYTEFSQFSHLVKSVSKALESVGMIPAIERVGLRYIDEIRVPEPIHDASDWGAWVNPGLIPSATSRIGSPKFIQGSTLYGLEKNSHLRLSYASLEGIGVVSNEPLRRKNEPGSGPFFVVDIDSFWEASSPEESGEFSTEYVMETLERLHKPTGLAFQSAITDRLREIFRGNDAE
ncbi:TIGR04255 family protein [Streptomyces virginiae]|uniref:TIGR04255 family protein n=1 Tax=Streptomyces virginiae TaxID=1961 RepID=UPI00343721B2